MNVVNNKKDFRYEIALESGEYAYLQYRWLKGNMVLMHTFVPKEDRGKGYATVIVKAVFESLRQKGLRAVVYCPFVAKYLETHHEYDDVVIRA
ncbi:MAG: N-acetyltransferase [Bacteroidetes bacterium]|nr:N-acetyltransferase [Bacteroidota bacterium]